MVETKSKYTFRANAENEIYLSLTREAWHSTLINQAVGLHMSDGALIDIADGNGVVSFWKNWMVIRRQRYCDVSERKERSKRRLIQSFGMSYCMENLKIST